MCEQAPPAALAGKRLEVSPNKGEGGSKPDVDRKAALAGGLP